MSIVLARNHADRHSSRLVESWHEAQPAGEGYPGGGETPPAPVESVGAGAGWVGVGAACVEGGASVAGAAPSAVVGGRRELLRWPDRPRKRSVRCPVGAARSALPAGATGATVSAGQPTRRRAPGQPHVDVARAGGLGVGEDAHGRDPLGAHARGVAEISSGPSRSSTTMPSSGRTSIRSRRPRSGAGAPPATRAARRVAGSDRRSPSSFPRTSISGGCPPPEGRAGSCRRPPPAGRRQSPRADARSRGCRGGAGSRPPRGAPAPPDTRRSRDRARPDPRAAWSWCARRSRATRARARRPWS